MKTQSTWISQSEQDYFENAVGEPDYFENTVGEPDYCENAVKVSAPGFF